MGPGWLHGPGRTGGQPCVRRSPGGFIGRVHRSSTPGGNHPFIGGYIRFTYGGCYLFVGGWHRVVGVIRCPAVDRSARHRFERGGAAGRGEGAWCRHKVGAC